MEPITYTSGDRIETQHEAIQKAIKIFEIEDKLSIDQVEQIVNQLIDRLCKAYGYSSSNDTFIIEIEVVQVATKLLFIKALRIMSDFASDAEENQIADLCQLQVQDIETQTIHSAEVSLFLESPLP